MTIIHRRRHAGAFATLILLAVCVAACSDSSLTGVSSSETSTDDVLLAKGGTDKVEICHFPSENPNNPQVITVGAKAADAHLKNHDGDGVVGVDLDGQCQPLVQCPCWERATIESYAWATEVDGWSAVDFDRSYVLRTGGGRLFSHVRVWSPSVKPSPKDPDPARAFRCSGRDANTKRNDPDLLSPIIGTSDITVAEAEACYAMLKDVYVTQNP